MKTAYLTFLAALAAVLWVVVSDSVWAGAETTHAPAKGDNAHAPAKGDNAHAPAKGDKAPPHHWDYEGDQGPTHWGELDPKFSTCASGKEQTPINIANAIKAQLQPIQFNYTTKTVEILNNGHTVQANFAPGSSITLEGRTFELKQVHFHVPSENLIQGRLFPMEAHFVHADKEGNLAVIGLMFEEGSAFTALEPLWAKMPKDVQKLPLADASAVSASDLLSAGQKSHPDARLGADLGYYRFSGSLTTPPCSEGVFWIVLKKAATASQAQIQKFADVLHHHHNNRPVQPVNARPILQ
ncbi:MAG: carbonic anhydrase family protein [Pseudomonadota bacterium]